MRRQIAVLRWMVLLWLVGAAGAGCLSSDTPEGPQRSPAYSGAAIPTFQDAVVVSEINALQGEFPVEVSWDGKVVLTCTHGGFQSPAPKFASEDGGMTWRRLDVEPTPAVSGDCWVDIGDDGTWYFIDSTVAGATVSSTTDGGSSWIVNPLSAPPVGGLSDRPYMAPLGGPGMALSAVQDYFAPGFVSFTRTTDRGETWEIPRHVSRMDGQRSNVMHGPMLVSDDRSTLRVPLFHFAATDFPAGNGAEGDLSFAVSRSGGVDWSIETVLDPVTTPFTPPTTAIDGFGTLYWAFQTMDNGTQGIVVVASEDDGKSWSRPVPVAGGWDYIGYMWMDGSPAGGAVIGWTADASVVDPDAEGLHLILAGVGTGARVDWVDAVTPASFAEFVGIAHDGEGRLHVMYPAEGQMLYLQEATDRDGARVLS